MSIKVVKGAKRTQAYWTAEKVIEMYQEGEINTEINIQRGDVWKDNDKKSALIMSLIRDMAIPPLYMNKINEIYDVEDGKQRILTISKFMNDEFRLSGLDLLPIVNENGEGNEIDINNLKFSELERCIQKAIESYTFTISITDNADEEEVANTFYNLNNGQAMNPATTNRVKAKSKKQIENLGKHKLFQEALSKTALDSKTQEFLVVKAHAILNDDKISTDAAWTGKYMKKTVITDSDEIMLNQIFDRIYTIHNLIENAKVAKKIYVRTHLISIVPVIKMSIDDKLSDKEIAEWFVNFFICKGNSTTISAEYNKAAGGSGTSKNSSVKIRIEELRKSYEDFKIKNTVHQPLI